MVNAQKPLQMNIANSNMTWFFSPIKSTDTNTAVCPDKAVLAVSQAFPS